jgi:hypothetical protein
MSAVGQRIIAAVVCGTAALGTTVALTLLPAKYTPDTVQAAQVPDSGKERWSVKVLRDPDAHLINFTPKTATVEQLSALPAPFTTRPKLSDTTRYPAERQVYSVTAQAVGFKYEADEDIHFVIKGASGSTMIVEFPDPSQSAKGIKGPQAAAARAACVKLFGQPAAWRKLSGKVTVTGVLFFDVKHGTPQTGVAKNGVELHEVLAFGVAKP